MDNREQLARMYYQSYSALCHDARINFTPDEESRLRLMREVLHGLYRSKLKKPAEFDMSLKESEYETGMEM